MNRRARRRAALALAAAALVAAAWAFKPFDRRAAQAAYEAGLAAALGGDAGAASEAFSRCLAARPSREDCKAALALATRALTAEDSARRAVADAQAAKLESEVGRMVARLGEAAPVVEVQGRGAPGVSEEDQRRAIKHWNEGIKAFQQGDMTAARDHWTLCGKFDPANEECVQGLARLARTYGEGL